MFSHKRKNVSFTRPCEHDVHHKSESTEISILLNSQTYYDTYTLETDTGDTQQLMGPVKRS